MNAAMLSPCIFVFCIWTFCFTWINDWKALKEKWPSYLINEDADCSILVLLRSVVWSTRMFHPLVFSGCVRPKYSFYYLSGRCLDYEEEELSHSMFVTIEVSDTHRNGLNAVLERKIFAHSKCLYWLNYYNFWKVHYIRIF